MHHAALGPSLIYLRTPLSFVPFSLMLLLAAALTGEPTLAPVMELGTTLLASETNVLRLFLAACAIHVVEAAFAMRASLAP